MLQNVPAVLLFLVFIALRSKLETRRARTLKCGFGRNPAKKSKDEGKKMTALNVAGVWCQGHPLRLFPVGHAWPWRQKGEALAAGGMCCVTVPSLAMSSREGAAWCRSRQSPEPPWTIFPPPGCSLSEFLQKPKWLHNKREGHPALGGRARGPSHSANGPGSRGSTSLCRKTLQTAARPGDSLAP